MDLVYYGSQRQLEYDFVVAPGADPGRIRLAFQGAEAMTLAASGDLVLHTAGGEVLEHAPVDQRWCLIHATHMTDEEVSAFAGDGVD